MKRWSGLIAKGRVQIPLLVGCVTLDNLILVALFVKCKEYYLLVKVIVRIGDYMCKNTQTGAGIQHVITVLLLLLTSVSEIYHAAPDLKQDRARNFHFWQYYGLDTRNSPPEGGN